MKRLTILGIFAYVVLFVVPASINAATQPPIIQGNVTVVNPPSQPVPVTGNVNATVPGNVSVTVPAGVTVTNPASQPVPVTGNVNATVPGNISVKVPEGVTVINTPTAPVPTYLIGPPPEPSVVPVSVDRALSRSANVPTFLTAVLYTVPANTILIIEYVSYFLSLDPGDEIPSFVVLDLSHPVNGFVSHFLPLAPVVPSPGDVGTCSHGLQLRIYALPGTTVEFGIGVAQLASAWGSVSLSGRLVPHPSGGIL